MSPTTVAAYSLLFVVVGAVFLAVNLILGRLLRPKLPNEEKLSVYECGEPTIGSSFVQFDLRFYVIALLFIIFDVEVAFFFPWGATYGKATHLMDPVSMKAVDPSKADSEFRLARDVDGRAQMTPEATAIYQSFGVKNPTLPAPEKSAVANTEQMIDSARTLAKASIFDILAFFAVLMVGFAYVWSRGDLDWVRATADDRAQTTLRVASGEETAVPVSVG